VTKIPYGSYSLSDEDIPLHANVYCRESLEFRPLIIVCFGGDFGSDGRSAKDAVYLCKELASKGFVAASIDYRTNFNFLGNPEREMYKTAFRGMLDVKAAINYFYNSAINENTFNIAHKSIYLAGISIGGVVALESAFVDSDKELSDNMRNALSTELKEIKIRPSPIRGVISLCGAVTSKKAMKQGQKLSLCLIHGDRDDFIPMDSGVFNYQGIETIPLFGAREIGRLAAEYGHSEKTLIFSDVDHVPWSSNWTYLDSSIAFIIDFLIADQILLKSETFDEISFKIYPNPAKDVLKIEADLGTSLQLIDIHGKELFFKTIPDTYEVYSIDMTELPKGFYHVRLISEHSSRSRSFFKQ